MFKSLDKLGRGISKAVDQAGRDISKAVDENWKSPVLFGVAGVVDKATSKINDAVSTFDRTCNELLFGDNIFAGLFSSIKTGVTKSVKNFVDQVSTDLDSSLSGSVVALKGPMADNLRTGNVVQLVSRASGKSLQIVMSPMGQLVVDGVGPIDNQAYHAHWTVLNEGKNVVRLHNQNNYLAIYNGATVLMQFPDPSCTSPETRFRLHQVSNFVCLESVTATKQHVGILRDGTLKGAVATGTEVDGQFGVQVVYSPYGPPAATGQTKK